MTENGRQLTNRTTGEILDLSQPADLRMLDTYAVGGVADEDPRIDALATISAGTREQGANGHSIPKVSKDGTIYLHDPKDRAPGLKAALVARQHKALTIAFPFDNPAGFVQQRFAEYSSTRLLAYGDEFALTTIDPQGKRETWESGTPEYEQIKGRCKVSLSVYFALAEWTTEGPRVVFPDGLGLYRLRSTSRNSLRNLRAAIAQVSTFTGGRLAGVPFDLSLDYRDVAGPDGSRRNVPCWTFTMRPPTPLTSRTFVPTISSALQEGRLLQLPAPRAETLDSTELDLWATPDEEAEYREVTDADVDLTARGGACDPRYYEAQWFQTVRGTRFDHDEARAAFIAEYTEGEHSSLKELLETMTNAEAEQLISAVSVAIEDAAAGARRSQMAEQMRGLSGSDFIGAAMGGIDDPPDEPPSAAQLEWYAAHMKEAEEKGLDLAAFETNANTTRSQLDTVNRKLAAALKAVRPPQSKQA